MPTFDIVSRTDVAEVDNALNNVTREVRTRYDFKGSKSSLDRDGNIVTILADDDMKLRALHEMLEQHLSRRKVDIKALDYKDPEQASGDTLRQRVIVKQGIETDISKSIVKTVKGKKLKVQVAVQGDEVRVTGKKRDDLQEVIQIVKDMKLDLPLQYVNFRD